MKKLLALLSLVLPVAAFAANPSFNSFNTNQFTNIGGTSLISIAPSASLTNTVFPTGLLIGDLNFITFTQVGSVRGNSGHTGGGSGGIEKEVEFASQGSFSFTGGQDAQKAGYSHLGASLPSHEYWTLQYDFAPTNSSPTNYDSGLARPLWGYSKPLGWTAQAGSVASGTVEFFHPAFRAEVETNNGVVKLKFYSEFGKQTGWNQNQLSSVSYSPGYFASNGITFVSETISNVSTVGALNAVTNVVAPTMFTTNLWVGNTTAGITLGSGSSTNITIGQNFGDTFQVFYNGIQMIELGARNGGSGNLRNTSGSIQVDWLNRSLAGGAWGSTGAFAAGTTLTSTTTTTATTGFKSGVTTAPSVISVGASPYTYTAGTVNETVVIGGGTLSSIVWAGTSLPTGLLTLGNSLPLGPGQTIVVTYTVAPSMVSKPF